MVEQSSSSMHVDQGSDRKNEAFFTPPGTPKEMRRGSVPTQDDDYLKKMIA